MNILLTKTYIHELFSCVRVDNTCFTKPCFEIYMRIYYHKAKTLVTIYHKINFRCEVNQMIYETH